jgi:hypothetical protein
MKPVTGRRSLLALACAAAGATTAFVPATAQAETPTALPRAQMHISTPDGVVTIQGTCGDRFNPHIPDNGRIVGEAFWDVKCKLSGDQWFVYMVGWVDDTEADGKCAWVRGERWAGDPDTQRAKDCPASGPRTNFTFKFAGRNANGYAYVA